MRKRFGPGLADYENDMSNPSHNTYYDKIDPTGFRAALMAQIDSRAQTVGDVYGRHIPFGRDMPIAHDYIIGTPEELASMLLSCILCLPMSERKKLIGLKE